MTLTSYRPDVDGLLAIVLHHPCAPLLPGGYASVDVFFVIPDHR